MTADLQPAGSDDRSLELLSVVVPVFNEGDTVEELVERVEGALGALPYELIFSDNASADETQTKIKRMAAKDKRIRLLVLSRNFGHQANLTAGLDHALGNAIVMMDADLQDPPELIPQMIEEWRRGFDVVFTVRTDREGETRFKLATARWFYRLLSRLTDLDVPQNAGDFRLLDRRALDALLALPERRRFLRGMSVWIGFKQQGIAYRREPRFAGQTKYSVRHLLRFSFDAITSFSQVPLQLASAAGFAVSALALLGLPLVIVARFLGIYVPGISTLLFAILFLGGIQLMTIGIIGEYLGRIYDEVKGRPLYVVDEVINVATPGRSPR